MQVVMNKLITSTANWISIQQRTQVE